MTELKPGWYPDPDDADARRYWDGAAWSAPLPMPSTGAVCVTYGCKEQAAAGLERCAAHDARAIERADAEVKANAPSKIGPAQLLCPHCQTRGFVDSRIAKQKKGVSGGKLTGAILTGGISMLGTGLSRKERVTEMHCRNCRTTWQV